MHISFLQRSKMTASFWKSTLLGFSLIVLQARAYVDLKDSNTKSIIHFSEKRFNQFSQCLCNKNLTCTALYSFTKMSRNFTHRNYYYYEVTTIKQGRKKSGRNSLNKCYSYHQAGNFGQIRCVKKNMRCQDLSFNDLFHLRYTCHISCWPQGIIFRKSSEKFRLESSFILCSPDCLNKFNNVAPIVNRTYVMAKAVEKTTAHFEDVSSTNETITKKTTSQTRTLYIVITVCVVIALLIILLIVIGIFVWGQRKRGMYEVN